MPEIPPQLSISAAFALGLVGGVTHCTAMCGGIVLAFNRTSAGRRQDHIAFQIGRATTYLILTLIIASIGSAVLATHYKPAGNSWKVILGVLLLILATSHIFGRAITPRTVQKLSQAISNAFRRTWGRGALGAFGAGLAWGLLPCMLSWPLMVAAATNPPVIAGLVITAFSLGTVLPLTGLITLDRIMSQRSRHFWNRAAGATLALYGLFYIATGAGLSLHQHHDHSEHDIHQPPAKEHVHELSD